MITVACVWVRGHVSFSPEYVVRLQAMVARYLRAPHDFVCLTDRPERLPATMGTMLVPTPVGVKGWWAKRHLFEPGRFDGRVLYLDLDTLVVDDLLPVVNFNAPLALIPDDAPNFNGLEGKLVIKRFNSSCMVFDAGVATDVYTSWTPKAASNWWGDQDWIAHLHRDAATMPLPWFPRLSQRPGEQVWTEEARVVLCKSPKNHVAAAKWGWFRELWHAEG